MLRRWAHRLTCMPMREMRARAKVTVPVVNAVVHLRDGDCVQGVLP